MLNNCEGIKMFKNITAEEIVEANPEITVYNKGCEWVSVTKHLLNLNDLTAGVSVRYLSRKMVEDLVDSVNDFLSENCDNTLERYTDNGYHYEVAGSWVENACTYTYDIADLLADSPDLGYLSMYSSSYGGTVVGDENIFSLVQGELNCWLDVMADGAIKLIKQVLEVRGCNAQ